MQEPPIVGGATKLLDKTVKTAGVSVTRQWNVRAPASEASILLRICHELHVAMSSHNLISNTISLSSYHHFEKAVFEISDPRPSGIRYFK